MYQNGCIGRIAFVHFAQAIFRGSAAATSVAMVRQNGGSTRNAVHWADLPQHQYHSYGVRYAQPLTSPHVALKDFSHTIYRQSYKLLHTSFDYKSKN
ncbi:hypothetical protein K1T71_007820 [Dendrolimus kikuchii]|uniref:Uncharacterized protein n=1 Tax=Dendrolimus kikuchii TaxID=765133 RepID=A0ACC1CY56_9NEOP|nr:hypothetical protein K1T71_007820 [Dendrolimus kikuchii]